MPFPAARRALIAGLLAAPAAGAQEPHAHPAADSTRLHLGAGAVGMATRLSPGVGGRTLTEGYLTQPVVHAHLRLPRVPVTAQGMLNLEGLTLERGELSAGVYGEGYVDRRHPHTLVHELVVGAAGTAGGVRLSLSAGKGFAPFGTDDPMARPLVKFPVNHHLAQLLERLVLVGAARRGPLLVEAALFNGDEPTSAWEWPRLRRFGDSWAARVTVLPAAGLELSASLADVTSPEHAGGAGLDQRKWSGAARLERGGRRPLYLLAEWARTDELRRARRAFRFESLLAEAATRAGPLEVAARLEQTDRPEEERLADPFRTPRPHGDFNLLGITRWRVASAHARLPLRGPAATRLAPFVEVAHARPTPRVRGALFVPAQFYGDDRLWSLSAGVRLAVGAGHARMGRYGVALPESPGPDAPEDDSRHH